MDLIYPTSWRRMLIFIDVGEGDKSAHDDWGFRENKNWSMLFK